MAESYHLAEKTAKEVCVSIVPIGAYGMGDVFDAEASGDVLRAAREGKHGYGFGDPDST